MGKKKVNRIVLMDVPWGYQYGRQAYQGVCRYAHSRCKWAFVRIPSSYDENRWLLRIVRGAGMVSMRHPQEYTPVAQRYGLTAVGVGAWRPGSEFAGLPYVDIDSKAIGEMAAGYFIDRGFRNFAMIVSNTPLPSPYRGEAFAAALRRKKFTCDVFDQKREYSPCGEPIPTVIGMSEQIRRWLAGLPKPLAVFCTDDSASFWACAVCQRSGIHVPEEVAVLGANDDEMYCSTSHPQLSSIRVPAEQVGFEAAKLLDAVLSGRKAPKRPVLLPPIGVVTRQSTDVMAIDDRRVADAVRYIRQNANDGIRVEDLMEHVSLPRRMLERRFRKAVGRSPFAEIRRVQIEKIKMLLAQTDMTLEAIVPECGFDSIKRMGPAFKKATGMTPGTYRQQFRSR